MTTNPLTEKELDDIYAFAIQLGKDAGKLLLEAAQLRFAGPQTTTLDVEEKESSVDIVTKTDQEVETFIKTSIEAKYPHHNFIGEETTPLSPCLSPTPTPTWCIDPLDGTVNYTHLFPIFCVSISLLVSGRPIIGVINAPLLNQLFTSCLGRGAYLNETTPLPLIRNPTIPPMPENAPQGCIFACEWGKDRRDVPDGNLYRKVESFVNMAKESGGMVQGVRSLGSAAMGLAYTAMGGVDVWWEGGCWEWDVAAGIAILQEAGGLVTTANPPEDPDTAEIEEVGLGSRLYLAIRPAGPSKTESGREGQERTVREVWRRVRELDYSRPRV
ncbi:inositol monophosphatase [Triangularia verruculosa]|uniref:Inositol-1-monophosphatase n=1 Tax=Triangularia verruculosa TaxID=2587418 RepID=A0AAN7AUM1_9PEZI|nr:inositol monophosphatase [Triangularia verruculosa]